MPEEASLYLRVRAVIAKKAGVRVTEVDCKKNLRNKPLYLTAPMIENLAPRFQDIAREWAAGVKITQADTAKLKDVLSAYNLVGTRAGLAKRDCGKWPLPGTEEP